MKTTCAKTKDPARAVRHPQTPSAETPPRILRFPEVRRRVGLSRSTMWRLIRRGEFPANIRLTDSAVGWREDQVDAWLRQRCGE